MTPLLPVVDSYFLLKGWPIQQHETLPVVRLSYGSDDGDWELFVQAREEHSQVLAYSVLPDPVEPDRRSAVGQLLHRLNSRLAMGAFEMNLDSGEVRFRTGLDLADVTLTEALLEPVIMTNLRTVEDYLPAILAVRAGTDPVRALADVQDELDSFDFIFQ